MVVTIYFSTFVISLAVLISLLLRHKRIVTMSMMFCILTTLNSLGRFLISISHSLELALLGNLFIYISMCYCPLLIVKIINKLCQLNLKPWISHALTGLSTLTLFLVLTTGRLPFYCSHASVVVTETFSYLHIVHGPAYMIYPIMICSYCAVMIYCLFCAIRRYKGIPARTALSIVILTLATLASCFLEHGAHMHRTLFSVLYLVTTFLFLYLVERINIYDLPSNIANSLDQLQYNAYVGFDRSYHCTGYSARVPEIFPEVRSKWIIGKRIPADDSFLYREVIQWVCQHKGHERKTIEWDSGYYELLIRDIPYGQKECVGYLLEITDRTAEMKYLSAVEHYNDNLAAEVKKKTRHISHIKDMMVLGLATMVESRDDSTGGHILRTSHVMQVFTDHIRKSPDNPGLTSQFLDMVTKAAPMHDLGKIAIEDSILRKQGKCTPEEFERMKDHPAEGARIVRHILADVEDDEFVDIAENVAHFHHERWDGTGYPTGLQATEIPIEARLMALADVFDALVSRRCYKEPLPYDQAFDIIQSEAGTHFDPALCRLFLECRPQLEELYDEWNKEDPSSMLFVCHG